MSLSSLSRSKRQPARGFTLIELMIVIAIIAVLAAILIPNYLHARAESQSAACETNEKHIAVSLEEYAVDNAGQYPATGAVVTTLFGAVPNPYMSNAPTDPVTPTMNYQYTTAAPDCNLPAGVVGYEVIDNGNHDGSVPIPRAAAGSRTIYYCSDYGIAGK